MTDGYSPVYGFLKNPTLVDFPGRLAVVFFISGCNFRCGYCHNRELITPRKERISWQKLEEACYRFQQQWVDAAVITGGEPTLAPDLPDLLRFLKSQGWAVKLDTNGSRPDVLEGVIPMVDYVAMDVKCGLDAYQQLTSFNNVERIVRSVSLIKELASDYEFRTTVIESFHDDIQMKEVASLVQGARRFVLKPFLPHEDLPDPAYNSVARTSAERLHNLKEKFSHCADEVIVYGG